MRINQKTLRNSLLPSLMLGLGLLLSACNNPSSPDTKKPNTEDDIEKLAKRLNQTQNNTHANTSRAQVGTVGHLSNFGDANFNLFKKQYRLLSQGKAPRDTVLNIVQLGDSHTASDTFTAPLRQLIGQDIGNAGIGWIPPMAISGQAHRMVTYQQQGWRLNNSRNETNANFPMGGFIATPTTSGAQLTIKSRQDTGGMSMVRLLVKPGQSTLTLQDANGQTTPLITQGLQASETGWYTFTAQARLPITVYADQADAGSLGGIWISQAQQNGVLISPVGSNGAQQSLWNRWQPNWMSDLASNAPNMIILAYGTNEAFNGSIDIQAMRSQLIQGIRQLRQTNPQATIVILGSPDSVDKRQIGKTTCGLPASFDAVKAAQQQIAQQEKTLYWDWQQAMGGTCQMQNWQANGDVARDLVHFTNSGYERSAQLFWADLRKMLQQ